MRHSRSILVIALLLSIAACGQGTTEPDALAAESESVSVPAPSFNAGSGEGHFTEDGNVASTSPTGTDSTTIIGGSGGRGLQYGGGQ